MNYELAKELKDAGFPQQDYSWICQHGNGVHFLGTPHCEKCFVPSLSELIEVCGDRFGGLEHWAECVNSNERWESYTPLIFTGSEPEHEIVVYAPTPDEAVAKLWLALNK